MKSINLTNKLVRDAHFCNSSLRSKTKMAGFSMMESVLSVFVLSMGIVGVMSLLVSSMKHSMDSRDTIIATELAQEGLELVRNVRDNNDAQGLNSFTNFTTDSANYRIDKTYSSGEIAYNNTPPPDYFKLRYNNNFYEHTAAGSATKFQRKIKVEAYGTTGKTITSTVAWGGSFSPCTVANKCVSAQSILVAR